MIETKCEQCGGLLGVGALEGKCPRCLMAAVLDSKETAHRTITFASTGADYPVPTPRHMPQTIARYRVVRLIGEGGMGSVYEAEQEYPRRTVAIKIIKPGLSKPVLLRRFEQEAEALGRLQHPGIAQIYEAGTADTGFGPQPYFAMEFIRGENLKNYADASRLTVRQRMEIMEQVCDAVQHAHQRGLIHRDLKPANILVDETGRPRILDFGVARVTDRDAQATTSTDAGQLIGTLAYMSPEQVLADPLELDTRSDVYALGMILYELLAGRLPYNVGNKLHEALTAIRDTDPARLSSVDDVFRGDIETIVAKALEKDKTRRYASAAELGADIRRYLTDQPIEARPPSVSYQVQKFARRHKAVVAGVAAVFVVLLGGIVASAREAARASLAEQAAVAENARTRAERDRASAAEQKAKAALEQALSAEQQATEERNRALLAEQRAQRDRDDAVAQKKRADMEAGNAQAVLDFLGNDLLRFANPLEVARANPLVADPSDALDLENAGTTAAVQGADFTMRDALNRAANTITGRFDKQPLVEAAIRETIGRIYSSLHQLTEAGDQLEKAVNLRLREQGDSYPDTLTAELQLAEVYFVGRRFEKAEELVKKVIQDGRRGPGDDSATGKAAVALYGSIYRIDQNADRGRKFADAERYFRTEIIDYQRRKLGEENETTLASISELVEMYMHQNPPRTAGVEAFLKPLIEDQRRTLGEGHPATVANALALLSAYEHETPPNLAEGIALMRTLVEAQRRALGEGHKVTAQSIEMLFGLLTRGMAGRAEDFRPNYPEAEAFLLPVLAEQRKKLGSAHGVTRSSVAMLAQVYFDQDKVAEAEALLIPLVTDNAIAETLRRGPQSEEPDSSLLRGLDLLSQIARKKGDAGKTEAYNAKLKQVVENTIQVTVVSNSLQGQTRKPAATLVNPLLSLFLMARQHIAANRVRDGIDLLHTVLEGYRAIAANAAETQVVANALTNGARMISDRGNSAEAEKLLQEVHNIKRGALGDDSPDTDNAAANLGVWYFRHGRYHDGEALLLRSVEMRTRTLGAEHVRTLDGRNVLNQMYRLAGRELRMQRKTEEARPLWLKAADLLAPWLSLIKNRAGGEDSSDYRVLLIGIGDAYAAGGDYATAERYLQECLDNQLARPDVQKAPIPNTRGELAWAQYHRGKLTQAEANLREAMREADQWEPETRQFYNIQSMLGAVLAAQKRFEEAEKYLLGAYEPLGRLTENFPRDFDTESVNGERILALYEAWGKLDKVAEWRPKVEEARNKEILALRR